MTGHLSPLRRAAPLARPAAWSAALGLAIAWPQVAGSNFLIDVGILALTFLVLTQSLNLVYGYAGFLCMAITVFWAAGGYVAAHLVLFDGIPAQLAIPLGGVAAGLVALAFGLVSMRRGREAFAILSLVLLIFAGVLADNWTSFTGGTQGLTGLPTVQIGPASWNISLIDDRDFYYATLGVACASIALLMVLLTSRWGRTIRAANVDESLAQSFGMSLLRERLRAITIAGFLSGMIGALYVFSVTLADPSLLSTTYLAPLFAALFLGGPGNFGAVAVASIAVTFLPQLTRGFQAQSNLVYGVLIVAICLLFPSGLPAALARARRLAVGWLRTPTGADAIDAPESGPGADAGLVTMEPR
jgi:branched-chain amino acid transport system permease protein